GARCLPILAPPYPKDRCPFSRVNLSWRGFHHHATLCIAAYGFLVTERLDGQKKTPSQLLPHCLPVLIGVRAAGGQLNGC
uniref:hypothetical protein n=1 Tax=Caballeronia terrestris TaxID=1226301 RepID=UPI001F364827